VASGRSMLGRCRLIGLGDIIGISIVERGFLSRTRPAVGRPPALLRSTARPPNQSRSKAKGRRRVTKEGTELNGTKAGFQTPGFPIPSIFALTSASLLVLESGSSIFPGQWRSVNGSRPVASCEPKSPQKLPALAGRTLSACPTTQLCRSWGRGAPPT